MVNISLVRRAWDKAKTSPEYDQGVWRCRTKMCLAGFIAIEGGWEWKEEYVQYSDFWMHMMKEGFPDTQSDEAAALVAELTPREASYLFQEYCSPEQIEEWISHREECRNAAVQNVSDVLPDNRGDPVAVRVLRRVSIRPMDRI